MTRKLLAVDAAASFVIGLVSLIAADPVARLAGVGPAVVRLAGAVLLAAAVVTLAVLELRALRATQDMAGTTA